MRKNSLLIVLVLLSLSAVAQVLAPEEVEDPGCRLLQKRYWTQLKDVAQDAHALRFRYPFSFSRVLDVAQTEQPRFDQRSIRFDRFDGRRVLAFSGNYYASYSDQLMDAGRRFRATFEDVMLPILKTATARLGQADDVTGFAFEVSHHVRKKVMKVSTEFTENVVLVLPGTAAAKLVAAKTPEQQQAALLEGQAFIDGNPVLLWVTDGPPPADWIPPARTVASKEDKAPAEDTAPPDPSRPLVNPKLLGVSEPKLHAVTAMDIGSLNSRYERTLAQMVQDLGAQAHFVSYAAPEFIKFRTGAYLQLPLSTALDAAGPASQYKLAAMAFDRHIAHLLRPVLGYFAGEPGFDGIDFSTSVRPGGSKDAAVSVEFILPLTALHCYQRFDCSGQKLIDAGVVLINGERVELDLQKAEGETQPMPVAQTAAPSPVRR